MLSLEFQDSDLFVFGWLLTYIPELTLQKTALGDALLGNRRNRMDAVMDNEASRMAEATWMAAHNDSRAACTVRTGISLFGPFHMGEPSTAPPVATRLPAGPTPPSHLG